MAKVCKTGAAGNVTQGSNPRLHPFHVEGFNLWVEHLRWRYKDIIEAAVKHEESRADEAVKKKLGKARRTGLIDLIFDHVLVMAVKERYQELKASGTLRPDIPPPPHTFCLDAPTELPTSSASKEGRPQIERQRDATSLQLADVTLQLRDVILKSSKPLPLYVSIEHAEGLQDVLKAVSDPGSVNISSVIVRYIAQETRDALLEMGALSPKYEQKQKNTLDRCHELLRERLDREDQPLWAPWRTLPPFHGFMYGDSLFYGYWWVSDQGKLTVDQTIMWRANKEGPLAGLFGRYRKILVPSPKELRKHGELADRSRKLKLARSPKKAKKAHPLGTTKSAAKKRPSKRGK
jgi:hypothetical protein